MHKLKEYKEWVDSVYLSERDAESFRHLSFLHPDLIKYIPYIMKRANSLSDLPNKKILIFSESGFGDLILLYRFLKQLPSLVQIHVLIPSPLRLLIQEDINNSEISNITLLIDCLPDLLKYDYFMWSFDLFRFFKPFSTDKYLNIPYEPAKTDKLKVGLALGNTDTEEGMLYRNVPREYSKYFKASNIELHNFCNYNSSYTNVRHRCHSFLDTAKVLQTMDCLITADNVMLHLAGALGVKAYAIFTHDYEPIWPDLNEENVGWYKSVKPYVCEEGNDFLPIIKKIKENLTHL